VEKPALLVAVQRVIGGVKVQRNLRRRGSVRIQEQIDKQIFDGQRIMADLVLTRRRGSAQLQPVQRALASQRCASRAAGSQLAGQYRHHRVVPQMIMVDQVLVAEGNAKYPLHHQRPDVMFDQVRPPPVLETSRKPRNQPNGPVRLPQQQCSRIRGNRPAIKGSHYGAAI
jgi:hypothetical protein